MDKTEFDKIFHELLDKDSPKTGFNMPQRTLTDTEATRFRDHLWELFFPQIALDPDTVALYQALRKTRNKYDSEQDRAAAMLALLTQPPATKAGGGK